MWWVMRWIIIPIQLVQQNSSLTQTQSHFPSSVFLVISLLKTSRGYKRHHPFNILLNFSFQFSAGKHFCPIFLHNLVHILVFIEHILEIILGNFSTCNHRTEGHWFMSVNCCTCVTFELNNLYFESSASSTLVQQLYSQSLQCMPHGKQQFSSQMYDHFIWQLSLISHFWVSLNSHN